MDSPSCLHMQHQPTMIIPHVQKFSIVRIFPKATDHQKKYPTLRGALTFQILFQEKIIAPPTCNTLWKALTSKRLLFVRI